jgi:hypothetical protein
MLGPPPFAEGTAPIRPLAEILAHIGATENLANARKVILRNHGRSFFDNLQPPVNSRGLLGT